MGWLKTKWDNFRVRLFLSAWWYLTSKAWPVLSVYAPGCCKDPNARVKALIFAESDEVLDHLLSGDSKWDSGANRKV